MSRRLWGACASEVGILGSALGPSRASLVLPGAGEKPVGWGLGFYQGGEPLIRKCPQESEPDRDLLEVVAALPTNVLIGHVREPTVGGFRGDNTHPFRFRQWLFAHSGTIGRFGEVRGRMMDAIPAFLQRGVKGDTDSECFFHLVLSFLYDARKLDDQKVDPSLVADAMAKAVQMVDQLEAGCGSTEPSPYLVVMTDGHAMEALRRSPRGLSLLTYEAPGRGEVRPRAVVLACELTTRSQSWVPVPDRSIVVVRHDLAVEVTEF